MKISGIIASVLLAQHLSGAAGGTMPAATLKRIERVTGSAYPGLARSAEFRATLATIATVPREPFVPIGPTEQIYGTVPVPIGHNQNATDVDGVALMVASLGPLRGATVLEVGTGSGYQTAILSRLASQVYSVEIVPELAKKAAATLQDLGYANVIVARRDGYLGWPEHAPFDAIVVAAGSSEVPQPLLDQVRTGGHLIMPIGPSFPFEQILRYTKQPDGTFSVCTLGPSQFVPLTGRGQRQSNAIGGFDTRLAGCFGHVPPWKR